MSDRGLADGSMRAPASHYIKSKELSSEGHLFSVNAQGTLVRTHILKMLGNRQSFESH